MTLTQRSFLGMVTTVNFIPLRRRQLWRNVLMRILSRNPRDIRLAQVFTVRNIVNHRRVTMLHVSLMVTLTMHFNRFFRNHPQFMVLPNRRLLHHRRRQMFQPRVLTRVGFRPWVARNFRKRATSFPVQIRTSRTIVSPLSRGLVSTNGKQHVGRRFR